jgi:hypothetical protein
MRIRISQLPNTADLLDQLVSTANDLWSGCRQFDDATGRAHQKERFAVLRQSEVALQPSQEWADNPNAHSDIHHLENLTAAICGSFLLRVHSC